MAQILFIDDDPVFRETVKDILIELGYECQAFASLAQGKESALENTYDIVLLDIFLPDGNGLYEIENFKNFPAKPQVIVITAHGNPNEAAEAIEHGAWDYIEKPVNIETIQRLLNRALHYRKQQSENSSYSLIQPNPIIGCSSNIKNCLQQLEMVAKSNTSVLITGETGTGKELFARTLHQNSLRAFHKFVVLDCAGLKETLAESALLGHCRGAFTDARQERTGLVKLADHGTLFLDEIGELPLSLQKILLRVLQEKTFLPLGGEQEQSSDFRLVAASNKDLKQMVDRQEFREDLFYRIFAYPIHLPPLRERNGDIAMLAEYFTAKRCQEYRLAKKHLSGELLHVLSRFSWPGNVRELINVLDVAIKNGYSESKLLPQHLPTAIRAEAIKSDIKNCSSDSVSPDKDSIPCMTCPSWFNTGTTEFPTLKSLRKKTIAGMEKAYLSLLLQQCDNNPQTACNISGLSRARLYELLKKHGLRFAEQENE